MQLSNLIRVYGNVVPVETCNKIIGWTQKHEMLHYKNETYDFNQLNVNEHDPGLAQTFALTVKSLSEDYFKALGYSDYIGPQSFEHVRIKKYSKSEYQEFRNHIDVIDLASAKRYLVAILYLNDNDGDTHFPQLNVSVRPQAGNVVLFPPLWMFPHAGKPPTTSDKYIMMTSLNYV